MALEPRCSIATHENGRFTLHTQNQTPTGARDGLAAALGGKPTDFRLIIGEIGGGFGMKTGVANEDALVAMRHASSGGRSSGAPDRARSFSRAHMGATSTTTASSRSTAKAGSSRCESRPTRISAQRRSDRPQSSALLAPKVQTTVYHVPAVDLPRLLVY
jgi:carbon-monoxide dehydrogenase large subunit